MNVLRTVVVKRGNTTAPPLLPASTYNKPVLALEHQYTH